MLLLALLAGLSTRPVLSIRPDDETAVVQWLDSSAHGFSSESPPPEDLAPLAAKLEGAQIIGIGEVTHGDHEDQTFKAELIKTLIIKAKRRS